MSGIVDKQGNGLDVSFSSNQKDTCYRVGVSRVRNFKLGKKTATYFFKTYKDAIAFYNMKGGTNYN